METEQDKFAYAKTLQNTLTQTNLMRLAHGVITANASSPETVKKNVSSIKKMLAAHRTNRFEKSLDKANQLARLAAHAALITKAEGGAA